MLPDPTQELTPDQERLRKSQVKWLKRIEREKDIHEHFRDEAIDAWANYLDDVSGKEIYYPLYWSVCNIEHSAVYSSMPNPDVRPRNSERNPLFKDAADVMQRALEFYLDQGEFDDNIHRTVDDYLVAALGVPRVKLDGEFIEVPLEMSMLGMDGEEITSEELVTNQMVRVEHVPYDRFGWEPCANWDHCEWIYFEHHLTRAEMKRRWPHANAESDDTENSRRSHDVRTRTKDNKRRARRVVVYEVWDKRNRQVLIIARGNDEPLEVNDDPLGLQGFYPVPKPLMLNLPSEELIPTTDYQFIQAFDDELQRLYRRSRAVTEQIKAASLHDGSLIEIEDWNALSDGDSYPVPNLTDRFEGGADIRKLMMFWPLEERVNALREITQQIEMKRRHVDDLLGISDILRGSSNPQDGQETQKIKERWSGIRLRRKQVAVQDMVRDLMRMMAEITVEHVTHEELERMTQIDISPQVYELLREDLMREFAISIETDSTVAKDEFQERRERTELLQGIAQYVQIMAPAVSQRQIPADLARETLQIATDPYKKFSRGLDDTIEQMPTTLQQLQQAQQQAQQQGAQLQQMQQQIQQLQYALDQYSQAEERRQDMKAQGTYAKDVATASEKQAGLTDEQLQAGKTAAETAHKQAQTDEIYHEMTQPREPMNGL